MAGRRDNGEGCIKQLPSGSYRWQITLGFDEHGKQLLKSGTEKTKRDAERARVQALADHHRGLLPIPSQIKLMDWLPQWLELKRPNLAPKTYANYSYVIDKHLTPLLGGRKLQDWSAPQKLDKADWRSSARPRPGEGDFPSPGSESEDDP